MFLGAAGRNAYLEVMMKMAEKYKKKMWGSVLIAYFHLDCLFIKWTEEINLDHGQDSKLQEL